MKKFSQIIPWLILLLSFAIPACFYNSIPPEILIARSFFGDEVILAPKSLFTVFRVPLIELVCAAVIEVMRRKFAATHADYFLMWNILLYTVALKSLLQSLEIVSANDLFYYLTFGAVIVGILAAVFTGRSIFLNFTPGDWRFSGAETAILVVGLVAYLGLAFVPIFVFK